MNNCIGWFSGVRNVSLHPTINCTGLVACTDFSTLKMQFIYHPHPHTQSQSQRLNLVRKSPMKTYPDPSNRKKQVCIKEPEVSRSGDYRKALRIKKAHGRWVPPRDSLLFWRPRSCLIAGDPLLVLGYRTFEVTLSWRWWVGNWVVRIIIFFVSDDELDWSRHLRVTRIGIRYKEPPILWRAEMWVSPSFSVIL